VLNFKHRQKEGGAIFVIHQWKGETTNNKAPGSKGTVIKLTRGNGED